MTGPSPPPNSSSTAATTAPTGGGDDAFAGVDWGEVEAWIAMSTSDQQGTFPLAATARRSHAPPTSQPPTPQRSDGGGSSSNTASGPGTAPAPRGSDTAYGGTASGGGVNTAVDGEPASHTPTKPDLFSPIGASPARPPFPSGSGNGSAGGGAAGGNGTAASGDAAAAVAGTAVAAPGALGRSVRDQDMSFSLVSRDGRTVLGSVRGLGSTVDTSYFELSQTALPEHGGVGGDSSRGGTGGGGSAAAGGGRVRDVEPGVAVAERQRGADGDGDYSDRDDDDGFDEGDGEPETAEDGDGDNVYDDDDDNVPPDDGGGGDVDGDEYNDEEEEEDDDNVDTDNNEHDHRQGGATTTSGTDAVVFVPPLSDIVPLDVDNLAAFPVVGDWRVLTPQSRCCAVCFAVDQLTMVVGAVGTGGSAGGASGGDGNDSATPRGDAYGARTVARLSKQRSTIAGLQSGYVSLLKAVGGALPSSGITIAAPLSRSMRGAPANATAAEQGVQSMQSVQSVHSGQQPRAGAMGGTAGPAFRFDGTAAVLGEHTLDVTSSLTVLSRAVFECLRDSEGHPLNYRTKVLKEVVRSTCASLVDAASFLCRCIAIA